MDTKPNDLTARNFPSAEEEAHAAQPPSRYGGPESAFRLAFTDTDFLLREELRPVRLQLELLKAELVQQEQGVESTVVVFGSARFKAPDVAEAMLRDAGFVPHETRALAGHELVVKLWTGVRREAGLGEDNVAQLEPRQSRKAP